MERQLRRLGWELVRHGSRHDVWVNGERQEVVPRHREINELVAAAILRRARQRDGLMRFHGKVYRSGKHWIVDVPIFDATTQGRSRKDALEMIADWFHSMVNRKGFAVRVHQAADDEIEVASDDTRAMISLMLQRQRQKSGLSLAQVSERLGARSRNAYARYEQGTTAPTVEKLDELLRAVAPNRDILVREAVAA